MGFREKQRCRKSSLAELGCLFLKELTYRYKAASPQREEWDISISSHWRHKICDWYYEFIDHYNFDREVVGVAISYFDRYISSQKSCKEDVHTKDNHFTLRCDQAPFHVGGSSCPQPPHALARLLYGHVDPQEIYEMEMAILQQLDWRLNPPTLHMFALNFSQLHPLGDCCSTTTSYLYEATRYQVELAIFIPELLVKFRPSVIVYAALKNTEEKIASENPHILTADMKQSFETLLKDPSIALDPTAVSQCQLSLKRLCPQLPSLEYFGSDTDATIFPSDHDDEGETSVATISPMNVVDY
ncbi:cyclin family protein [Skeletonema marinoi]|uniref:Cyclin family protein n=1 Tax=Skeletonema marinoi TaxID=267567 RepID=A0AAD8Y5J1_9STRA|nr:cyclin family protein [Skeletonema marinoi]